MSLDLLRQVKGQDRCAHTPLFTDVRDSPDSVSKRTGMSGASTLLHMTTLQLWSCKYHSSSSPLGICILLFMHQPSTPPPAALEALLLHSHMRLTRSLYYLPSRIKSRSKKNARTSDMQVLSVKSWWSRDWSVKYAWWSWKVCGEELTQGFPPLPQHRTWHRTLRLLYTAG